MNPGQSSIAQLLSPDVLQRLGRLDLIGEIVGNALKQGVRRSLRHGFSTEFSDYKPYAPGDDLRFLDWRVFGRTDRLLTRKYEAETSFESLLLLDASKSMAWRWKSSINKLEYGTNLFAAMAYLHVDHQDQVGLLVHDANQMHFLPPRSTKKQLQKIYETLAQIDPGPGETFLEMIEAVARLKKHRGQIVVCSDLEESEEAIERSLQMLAGRDDEVVILHLLHKAEIELPFRRATHFEDSETGELLAVDLEGLKQSHRENVGRLVEKWRHLCEAWRIRYQSIHTGMTYVDVLLQFCGVTQEE